MDWRNDILDRLAAQIPCGYHPSGPAGAEPTALAAMALSAANRPAAKAVEWLGARQSSDGSVSTLTAPSKPREGRKESPHSQPTSPAFPGLSSDYASEPHPDWPTGWAILAALSVNRDTNAKAQKSSFDVSRATNWILQSAGDSAESDESRRKAAIVGWPWVNGTYSWVEPTAIHIVALKAAGFAEHRRTREAMTMLTDRLLPSGGCNYGNTIVLGQELLPHVQPTGLAILALAGSVDADGRIERSLRFLEDSLSVETTAASLSYGLIGLAAHDRYPAGAAKWLEAAYRRTIARDGAAYKLALLSLAVLGEKCPLVALSANPARVSQER